MSSQRAIWRDDIDALQFEPAGHGGLCLIHRLAFRKLLGSGTAPDPAKCLSLFENHHPAFIAAAITKIAAQTLPPGRNFHLNSRDVRRQIEHIFRHRPEMPALPQNGYTESVRY